MLLKKSKLLYILCSLLIGTAVAASVLLLVAALGGTGFANANTLVLITDTNEKRYDGTPLTDVGWRLEGELKPGHRAEPSVTGARTTVGESENKAELKIVDKSGNDVTAEYRIRYEFGTLTVTARSLTVVSDSASKTFDETPLTAPGYEISSLCDGLVIGHSISVEVTGHLAEIGRTPNTIASVTVFDGDGNDVTSNYRLLLREGLLAIDGGSGSSIFDDGSSDLQPEEALRDRVIYSVYAETSGYLYLKVRSYGDYTGTGWKEAPVYTELLEDTWSAAYLTSFALTEASQRAKTVRIKSFCGNYGIPYYFTVGSGEVQADDTYFSGNTDDIYEIEYYGLVSNTASLYTPYVTYEKAYRDFVYANYLKLDAESLSYMTALIEREKFSADDPSIISSVATYIQNAAVYTGDYPKEMEEEKNVAIAFLETYREGVCRHYASAAVLLYRALGIPARYTVGALADTVAGAWTDVKASSAHAWVEVYLDGVGWVQVEVTGSADEENTLTLKPAASRYRYDGNAHTASAVLEGFEEYAQRGYTYTVEISGSRSEPGITETEITSVKIFNSLGKDVTFRFRIRTETGVLQVYLEELSFESKDEFFTYGSLPSSPSVEYELSGMEGVLSVRIERKTDTGVGLHMNEFEVTLLNADGEDVTELYRISKTYGVLRVVPLQITLKAGDAEKVYDGEALTCDGIEIVSGKLKNGHTIIGYEISGSQKMVGRSENEIVYVAIHDKNGKNVSANYAITLLPGQLRVTLR